MYFKDNFYFQLPQSIITENHEIKWLRPERYIRQRNIEKELKIRMPNRNTAKVKNAGNEIYLKMQRGKEKALREKELKEKENESGVVKEHEEVSEGNSALLIQERVEADKKFENKKKLYREYFHFLSEKLNIKVCDYIERDETEEEIKKRIEEKELEEKFKAEMQHKDEKNKKNIKISNKITRKDVTKDATLIEQPLNVRDLKVTNIDMSERYCRYSKWVASQLQLIYDLDILDVNVSLY